MSKILYINLPYKFKVSRTSRWPEKTKSGTLYYPYWLAYSAGYSQTQGFEVKLIDCVVCGDTPKTMLQKIGEYNPDCIVAEITTSTCGYDFKLITAIKKHFPNIKLLVGGTHTSAVPEHVLNNCPAVDVLLIGEYEQTIVDIVSGTPLEDVAGICYNKGGNIVRTGKRSYIDLDKLPFVSKVYNQFLKFNDYSYSFAQKPMIQIFSARGCPHRCNYCSYPETMGGRVFRKRGVNNFVDELEYIYRELPQIREIFIEDDTFTIDRNRVVKICDEILRRGLKLIWSCNTRADLPFDVMRKMKRAGCKLLVVGYESGSNDVLKQIHKGITLEQSLAFAGNTKKAGLKVFGCFMIGLTGDTLKTIEETYQFAKKCKPDMCFFQQAVPFPNTHFYDWAKSNGYLITEDYTKWLNEDGVLRCLVDYPYADHKAIEKLRDKLMSRYYFSPQYMVKTVLDSSSSPAEFARVMRGGFGYIGFRIKKALRNK